jgi:hypothetical protein
MEAISPIDEDISVSLPFHQTTAGTPKDKMHDSLLNDVKNAKDL